MPKREKPEPPAKPRRGTVKASVTDQETASAAQSPPQQLPPDAPPPLIQPDPEPTKLRTAPEGVPVKVYQEERREFVEVSKAQAAGHANDGDTEDPILPDGWDFVDEEEDNDQFAQLRRFMTNIEGDAGDLRVAVKRLPDTFDMRGKFRTPCSTETQHGDVAFDPDNLINNIRDTLGGGLYRLTIRNGRQGTFITRPIQLLIADPPGWSPTPVTPLLAPTNGRQEKPEDPLASILRQAGQFKQLREALGMPENNGKSDVVNFPPGTDPKLVMAQHIIGNTGVLDDVVKSLVANAKKANEGPEPAPWYKDVLLTFVQSPEVSPLLVHAVLSLLTSLLELFPRNQAIGKNGGGVTDQEASRPVPSRLAMPPIAAPPDPASEQAPAEEPDPEMIDDSTPPYLKVLDFIMTRLKENAKVSADEKWVTELHERYPDEVQQAEGMLRMLSAQQIKMILVGIDPDYQTAFDLPHADQFLADLKQLVTEEGATA